MDEHIHIHEPSGPSLVNTPPAIISLSEGSQVLRVKLTPDMYRALYEYFHTQDQEKKLRKERDNAVYNHARASQEAHTARRKFMELFLPEEGT